MQRCSQCRWVSFELILVVIQWGSLAMILIIMQVFAYLSLKCDSCIRWELTNKKGLCFVLPLTGLAFIVQEISFCISNYHLRSLVLLFTFSAFSYFTLDWGALRSQLLWWVVAIVIYQKKKIMMGTFTWVPRVSLNIRVASRMCEMCQVFSPTILSY